MLKAKQDAIFSHVIVSKLSSEIQRALINKLDKAYSTITDILANSNIVIYPGTVNLLIFLFYFN